MPMSRAEAICACNNIVELVEQMDDKLPDTFSTSVDAKAKSMLDYIMKTPQYPRVTEKMDQALRNMWGGLQKWNRNGDYNDNLFDGVEAIAKELKNVQDTYDKAEGGEESSSDAEDSSTTAVGIEDFDLSDDPKYAGVASGRFPANAPNQANSPKVNVVKGEDVKKVLAQPVHVTGLPLEDIIKIREELISRALNQVHEKHISAIDTRGIRHGLMDTILKATKSDRTTQLLWAAYFTGKISGLMQLGEELSTEAGKK